MLDTVRKPSLLDKKLQATIQKYLDIPDVENININKPHEVFYEVSGGKRERVEDPTLSLTVLQDLASIIATYNGIRWRYDLDTLSAKLPDGTRVEVFQSKSVLSGFSMALRKRKSNSYTLKDFGFDDATTERVIKAINNRANILVSGGTSTGKTSLLEILAHYIPTDTRLITIQDPIEIEFTQPNRLDLTVTSAELDKRTKELNDIAMTAMRQNPDSIIFGELRERTMSYAFRVSINTGHDGCMATIHANNPDAAIERLSNLVHGAEGGDKKDIVKELTDCLDIVIQLRKLSDGKRTAEIKFFD
jgi:Flp pilus assembly CpaF family ATPase